MNKDSVNGLLRGCVRVLCAAFFILPVACSGFTIQLPSQDPPTSTPPSPREKESKPASFSKNKPLLLLSCFSDPAFFEAARSMNAAGCPMIYQQEGETNNKFDEMKLRRSIASKVAENYEGYAILDFEGQWTDYLNKKVDEAEFKRSEAAMLKLIQVAKSTRPKAKWTMYGLPAMSFWAHDERGSVVGWDRGSKKYREERVAKAKLSQPIIDACDWVAPSVYAPYSSAAPEVPPRTVAYVKIQTETAIEMAKGKPVFPVVWHRLHDSNAKDGLSLLSDQDWLEMQVKPALAAGAAGVLWWGADQYQIRVGELQKRRPQEFTPERTASPQAVAAYALQLHRQKLEAMRGLFPP